MIFYNYPIKEKKLKNRKVLKYQFNNYFTLCKRGYRKTLVFRTSSL